jgi:hypothetical protein
MGPDMYEKRMKKCLAVGVLYSVMGQDSGRLGGIDEAEAARPKMGDDAAQCRRCADETAVLAPSDEIDMDIRCGDAGSGAGGAPRAAA